MYTTRGRNTRAGFTLVELMVVVVLMGVMAAMAAPKFGRAIEISKADVAMANLKSIWSAERYFWIVKRSYTPNLTDLQALQGLDLIDQNLTADHAVALAHGYPYTYSITYDSLNSPNSFVVAATRVNSGLWSGQLQIDQTGRYVPGQTVANVDGTSVIAPPQWETSSSGN